MKSSDKGLNLSLIFQAVNISSNFYSLENLLKDFIEKNNLPKGYDVKDTKHGKLIRWRKDHKSYFILSQKGKGIGPLMQPDIRGDGNHTYTSNEVTYLLNGELKGKKVNLEAEITETQDYKMEKNPASPCFADQPLKNGEPQVYKSRDDKEKYWFVVESKMNEEDFKERLKKSTEKSFAEYDNARRKTAVNAKNKILD